MMCYLFTMCNSFPDSSFYFSIPLKNDRLRLHCIHFPDHDVTPVGVSMSPGLGTATAIKLYSIMSNLSQFAFSPLGTSFRGCICPGTSSLSTTSSCSCANYTIQTTACDSQTNLGCLIRLCNIARRILYCNNFGHCSLYDVYVIYIFQNSCCPCVLVTYRSTYNISFFAHLQRTQAA